MRVVIFRRALIILLLLAMLGMPASPSSARDWVAQTAVVAQVAQADQGLNGGWAIDDSGHIDFLHSLSSSLGTMHDAGAGWARIVFRLGGCYPSWTAVGCDGRTALQAYDQVLVNIRGHNLKVLGILTAESWPGTQTDWTANNAETAGGNGDNPFVQAFAQQAAGVLAQHFAAQVGDWEVWNEPNAWTSTDNQGHFFGSSFLYPSNYAWLLNRSYAAIKTAQPGSRVAFGGLFGHEPFGVQMAVLVNGRVQHVVKRGDMPGARRPLLPAQALRVQTATPCASTTPPGSDSGASYLCASYSVGLGFANWIPSAYPFDDVSQHLYLALGSAVSGTTITTYLHDLRQAYLAYEGPGTTKRTLVTEIGWPTDQVSPQVQSDNLRVAFQTLRAANYVARSFWFNTQDVPEGGLFYGLVDTNGLAKPALSTYQQEATYQTLPAPTSTPTSVPILTPTPGPTTPPSGIRLVQALAQPQRVADTRTGGGPIASGLSRCFQVAGLSGIPSDAAAVLLNVTAVGYATQGWLSVFPSGQNVPATSTVNFDSSEYAVANGSIMRLGSDGQVCVNVGTINNAPGSSQVILDATGFLSASALAQLSMLPSPQRVADTRSSGGAIQTGQSRCFTVAGVAGVPADAAAVLLNVTAAGYATRGWLSVYPNGQSVPATSTVNFDTSEYAIANGTIMRVGSGGQVCVNLGTINNVPGSSQAILDVTGYLTSNGLTSLAMLPSAQRVADTRSSGGSPIQTGQSRCFTVAGVAGIPANATAVVVNVTAVSQTTNGWLTAFSSGQAIPATSTLNFDPSEYAMANGTILAIGAAGQVCVNAGTINNVPGSSHAVLDVVGYITP